MKALILMTRVPVVGKTKTRLIGDFSPKQAAALHFCFLKDIALELQSLCSVADLFVSYGNEGKKDELQTIFDDRFQFFSQKGATLGDKMAYCFQRLFSMGYQKILLIGADTPQLNSQSFHSAFDALEFSNIVLGPTFDGGYYLIGMKKFISELFSPKINWGTANVLKETLQKVERKEVFLLAKELDIDEPKDLKNFICVAKERNNSKNTLEYLIKICKK